MYAPSRVAHSVDGVYELGLAFKRLTLLVRTDVQVLSGLTWRRVGYTVLVAAGFALWTALGNWVRFRYGLSPRLLGLADLFLHKGWGCLPVFRVYLLLFFSQMLALTIADNLHVSRVPRTVLLVFALVLGTTVGSAVVMASGDYLDWPPVWGLTWGGLLAFVYFKRRRDEELAVALHAAQLAQVDLKKKTLESDLQVMQAQVEPQFLFNTLRRVGDLYETDRPSADRMLENLILYLRAALPQMRTSNSTLGQEVRLAQAYLNIERIRTHGKLDFAFDIPDRLVSAAFPPMVLLPLIEALALRGHNLVRDRGVLCAAALAGEGSLKITLTRTWDSRPDVAEIQHIRGRLKALYDADGKLELAPLQPSGAVATMEVPLVPG